MTRLWGAVLLGATASGEDAVVPAEQPAQEEPLAGTIQAGTTVRIDYTLTVDDGVVDSSDGRGPLTYVHGQGEIVPGLERQLAGLKAGDVRDIAVSPEEGYGAANPEAFVEIPKTQLPQDVAPKVGMMLQGMSQQGTPFRATIHEINKKTVTLNLNHPLAGKALAFHVTVVDVTPKP
mgnify:CR=1 FL=1